MKIRIAEKSISIDELEKMAQEQFGQLIKAVVDIKKRIMALDGDLHADEEQLLLEEGSKQEDLWGINLYPSKFGTEDFIEFDSMINVQPRQNNFSRGIENKAVRRQVMEVVANIVKGPNK